MRGPLRQGSLYILLGAVLTGTLWRGSYFPTPVTGISSLSSLLSPRWLLVSLLLLAGVWELVAVIAERRMRVLLSPALWLFGAFAAFAAASRYWSVVSAVTTRDVILLTAYLAALFTARSQIGRYGGKVISAVSWWLVYTAGFVSVWGIFTYIHRMAPYANQVDGIYRAGGTLEYSNALACLALMAMPVTAALMRSKKREDRLMLAVGMTILTATVILTLSRSAAILLIVMYVYLLTAGRRAGQVTLLLSSFMSAAALAAAAMYTSEKASEHVWIPLIGLDLDARLLGMAALAVILVLSHLWQRYLEKLEKRIALLVLVVTGSALLAAAGVFLASYDRARNIIHERFIEGFTFSKLLPHRADTFTGAVEAWREHPVRGWGHGSFARVYQDFFFTAYTKYAHNLVLQAAVETGIIGAVLISLFLLYVTGLCLFRLFAVAAVLVKAAAVSALVFIAFNMFDWEWYVPALTAWFMIIAAVIESSGREAGEEDAA